MNENRRCSNGISRTAGIIVDGGYVVGGGYAGLTKELDETVKRQAEWLREQFPGHDVQIRFNSDRKSGGAFIESSHTIDGVVYIKLGASLTSSKNAEIAARFHNGEISFDEYVDTAFRTEYDRVSFDIGVNVACTENTCPDRPTYGDVIWKRFDSYESALRYIQTHVQRIRP